MTTPTDVRACVCYEGDNCEHVRWEAPHRHLDPPHESMFVICEHCGMPRNPGDVALVQRSRSLRRTEVNALTKCEHRGRIKVAEHSFGIDEYRCPSCGARWRIGGTTDEPVLDLMNEDGVFEPVDEFYCAEPQYLLL